MKKDIKFNLNELHKLNIVYIELKLDNIGYSEIDKRYKLFDFDCSGVFTHDPFLYNKWIYKPISSYLFSKLKINDIKNFIEIDDMLYSLLFN
jgi:serine/threonine protein kinase